MFRYCDYMVSRLNFWDNTVEPCCIPAIPIRPKMPLDGHKFNINEYEKQILDFMHCKNEIAGACEGCEHLVKCETPDHPQIKSKFDINFNYNVVLLDMETACNCNCDYCNVKNRPANPNVYDSLQLVNHLFENNRIAKNTWFGWSGGEPTLYPYFEKTCRFILEKGFNQNVHTNAINYSEPIYNYMQKGMGTIIVSLDSGSKESYKRIKGVDRFEAVYNNLKAYAEGDAAKNVRLKYIIYEKNNSYSSIEEFLNLCKTLNLTNIQYSLNFNEIAANCLSDKTLRAAAYLIYAAKKIGLYAEPFAVEDRFVQTINNYYQEM